MRPRTFRGLCAAAIATALAGCATSSAPPVRQAERAPPASAYAEHGLASEAQAFEAYTRRAAAIDPSFSGPGEVDSALTTAAGYEPRQLEASMVAFAALAALQEPAFIASVRAHREAARRLTLDPRAALELPGASAAAARASAALQRRGAALSAAGWRVKQAAYSVQHQSWSRARLHDGGRRLLAVKEAAGYRPAAGDRAHLAAAVAESGREAGGGPAVERGVAVAALTVLGEPGAARSLMYDPHGGACLREAKLNFHQCLAAAGTPYEDVYCLGLHAMADPGRCVVDAARGRMHRASLD